MAGAILLSGSDGKSVAATGTPPKTRTIDREPNADTNAFENIAGLDLGFGTTIFFNGR